MREFPGIQPGLPNRRKSVENSSGQQARQSHLVDRSVNEISPHPVFLTHLIDRFAAVIQSFDCRVIAIHADAKQKMLVDTKHVFDRRLKAAIATDLESGQRMGFRKAPKKNRSLLSARYEEGQDVISPVKRFPGDFVRDQHQDLVLGRKCGLDRLGNCIYHIISGKHAVIFSNYFGSYLTAPKSRHESGWQSW